MDYSSTRAEYPDAVLVDLGLQVFFWVVKILLGRNLLLRLSSYFRI